MKLKNNRQLAENGKMSSLKQGLISVFLAVFVFVFAIVTGSIIFANTIYDMTPVLLIVVIAIYLLAVYLIGRAVSKHMAFLERHFWKVIPVAIGILLVVNIVTGCALRYIPSFDLGAVFTCGAEWASTGNFMEHINEICDSDYFYYFPNNLGAMTFFFVIFKAASVFGAADYYAIAMTANAFLVAATVLVTVLTVKRLFGTEKSIMSLVCVLLMPTFYFAAAVFYTDTLSMLFPILTIYLYLRYLDAGTAGKKVLFAILVGIACAIGMLIKFTVIIAYIAIVLYHLIRKDLCTIVPIIAIPLSIIIGASLAFNMAFYGTHIDEAKAKQLKTPYTHWIMMSLYNDGRYNGDDYAYTRSFDDPQEREEAIAKRIKERIKDRGIVGMLKLFETKGVISFGDGTLAQSDFLDDNPQNDTFLHKYILYGAERYNTYKYVCAGSYYGLYILMLAGAVKLLFTKKRADSRYISAVLPMLCVFGIFLFLMMWEVSGRYVTNLVPVIIIAAISGLDSITKQKTAKR